MQHVSHALPHYPQLPRRLVQHKQGTHNSQTDTKCMDGVLATPGEPQHPRHNQDTSLVYRSLQADALKVGSPIGCFAHVGEAISLLHFPEASPPSSLLGLHVRHWQNLVLLCWSRLLPLVNLLLHLCLRTRQWLRQYSVQMKRCDCAAALPKSCA